MCSPSRPASSSSAAALGGLALALAFALGPPPPACAGTAGYAVVVSPDVTLTSVTLSELRRMFRFEKRFWKSGVQVGVLLPPMDSPARVLVLRRIYRTDEADLRRLILERMFQGQLDLAPKVAGSDDQAVAFVTGGRGLLAVVAAKAEGVAGARTLKIDGKLPGQAGYPLAE